MRIAFDIRRLVPDFLMADRNGKALALAIERAFRYVAEKTERGIEIVMDVDKMPEWRLDEMAGELGCIYDYSGTIERKRYWIKNARYLFSIMGTKRAIINFLEGYFQEVDVEEYWQYSGDPFHFRVILSGTEYDEQKILWAQKAISAVKNLRSTLDDITVAASGLILVGATTEKYDIPALYAADSEITGANITGDWTPISE